MFDLFSDYVTVSIDISSASSHIGRDYFYNTLFYIPDEPFSPPMQLHDEQFKSIRTKEDALDLNLPVIDGELTAYDFDSYAVAGYMRNMGLSETVVNWLAVDSEGRLYLHSVSFIYECDDL